MKSISKGFTLVELAVVILIVTLLLGSLLVPLTSQVEQRNTADTQKALDEIREALFGYAMIHGRLPRPAQSGSDGTERGDCTNDNECTGWLPWRTLGVARADAWGHFFRYSVTPTFANDSAADDLTLDTEANRNIFNGATKVPAVVISFGAQRSPIDENGNSIDDGSATNTDEDSNYTGPLTYVYRAPSQTDAGGGPFDDIVVWIPTGVLFNRMVAAGKLP
jgi:prepilin-type N-terminal cleavage/methylation domain-containing protein